MRKHGVRDKVFSELLCLCLVTILLTPSLLAVASKCGFDVFGDGSVTNSASHIRDYIDGSIERLGFAPDLYYLHRIDPSTIHPGLECMRSSTYRLQIPLSKNRFQPSMKFGKRGRLNILDYRSALSIRYVGLIPVSSTTCCFKDACLTCDPTTVAKIDAVQAEIGRASCRERE